MTENKRFILTEQFNGLQGVTFVKDDCADVDTYYTVDGTVDLLNQFAKENEELKKDCSNLIDDNTEYVAEINQMHKENEQLKADKQALIDFIKKEFPKSYKHILEGFND